MAAALYLKGATIMGAGVLPPGQPLTMQPGEFTGASIPNLITFNTKGVAPPSSLYMQRDDKVVVTAFTSTLVTDSITVSWRILEPSGYIQTGQQVVLTAGGVVVVTITAVEGFLLSVGAYSGIAQLRGSTYVTGVLQRPANSGAPSNVPLFADYATQQYVAGWPNGRSTSSIEGPGNPATTSVSNPAAGANFTFTQNTQVISIVRSVTFQLATAVAVANRIPRIQISDNAGRVMAVCEPNQVVAASLTVQCTAQTTQPGAAANVPDVTIALPTQQWLPKQGTLSSSISNLQAADQISNIVIMMESYVSV